MTVKLRRVGTSNTLTVPSFIKPVASEYQVFVAEDGVIFYVPKKNDQSEIERIARKHGAFLPYQYYD